MIMSLIIILPLISSDTWFNNDPTIDQMMSNYFNIPNNFTDPLVYEYLCMVLTTSFSMSSPIIYMKVFINNNTYIYPDNFPNLAQPESISDFM